ncbi:VWA1 protein, partial [Polypterus senegalus]
MDLARGLPPLAQSGGDIRGTGAGVAEFHWLSPEVMSGDPGYCKSSEASTDLIFLLDSSSSITPWEFSSFLSVFKNLVSVLNVGPNHVQIALVSVSDLPVLEFSFQQHTTAQEILRSLSNVEQRMGSTNSGLALKWVYEIGFTKEHGSRDAVQKTVVWVTDGLSTDDVAWPAKVLKDAGILVLVVSTGRSSHGIQNVASSERTMFFVDTDKLLDLVVDLCVAIVGSAPLPGPNMRNEIPDIAAALWQQSGSPFKKQNSLDIFFNRVQSDIGASSQMNEALESHNMTRQSENISVLTSVNTSESPIDTSTSHPPVSPQTLLVSESGPQTLYLSIPPSFHSRYPYKPLFDGMPGRTIGSKGGVASLEVKAEGKEARVVQVKANSSSLISTTSHFKQGAKKPYSLKSRTSNLNAEELTGERNVAVPIPPNQTNDCKSDEFRSGEYCCNKCPQGYKLIRACKNHNERSECEMCENGTFLALINFNKNCFRCKECNSDKNDLWQNLCIAALSVLGLCLIAFSAWKVFKHIKPRSVTVYDNGKEQVINDVYLLMCLPIGKGIQETATPECVSAVQSRSPTAQLPDCIPQCTDSPFFYYSIIKVVPVNCWKEFIRRLGLSDHEIEVIQRDHPYCFRDAQYEMMRRWRMKNGPVMPGMLTVTLTDMELAGCAEELYSKLKWQA